MRLKVVRHFVMAVAAMLFIQACQPIAASPPAIPTDLQINTTQTTPLESDRISATIPVNSPSTMTFANGRLWVLAGGSIIQIDPKMNQVVGEPISPGTDSGDGDIAVSNNTLWVTTVGPGDLGAPSDLDAVSAIDPESGEIL